MHPKADMERTPVNVGFVPTATKVQRSKQKGRLAAALAHLLWRFQIAA
jgi:hypothetical protein